MSSEENDDFDPKSTFLREAFASYEVSLAEAPYHRGRSYSELFGEFSRVFHRYQRLTDPKPKVIDLGFWSRHFLNHVAYRASARVLYGLDQKVMKAARKASTESEADEDKENQPKFVSKKANFLAIPFQPLDENANMLVAAE